MSSLYLSGIGPPRITASSKATKALKASGASSPNRLSLLRFFMSYMGCLLVSLLGCRGRARVTPSDVEDTWRGLHRPVHSGCTGVYFVCTAYTHSPRGDLNARHPNQTGRRTPGSARGRQDGARAAGGRGG